MLRTWLSAGVARKNQSTIILKIHLGSFRLIGRDGGGWVIGRKVKKYYFGLNFAGHFKLAIFLSFPSGWD